jgi:hypothetical protein
VNIGYWVLGNGYWVMGNGYWVMGIGQRELRGEFGMGNESKSEFGMRPPAHRGLRLRPGGKAEI